MAITRRYQPEHPPGESSLFAYDYSAVLPPGMGLTAATLAAYTNTNPASPSNDFTIGAVSVRGRMCWASISGGVEGTDYQLRWSATDSAGNVWPRTALILCAQTS